MIKFHVYKGKDLQNFISFLDQMENNGIIDIRSAKDEIQKHIQKRIKISTSPARRILIKECPSCDKGSLELFFIDGEKIRMCKKCRYSEYIGETYGE